MKWLNFSVLILFIACAGTKPVIEESEKDSAPVEYDESFDPMDLNDDDIVISNPDRQANTGPETTTTAENADPKQLQEVNGFRVQLLATRNIETASLFEQEAGERFGSFDHKTYLVYETPLYKIRIGDCLERNQAEELRELAKQYGYREAFIVRSKIKVPE